MHSTLKLRDSDPHDDFAIAPDGVTAAWADKVLADITGDARIATGSADLQGPRRQPPAVAAAAPMVDTTFRATVTDTTADDVSAPVAPPLTSRLAKIAFLLVFAIGSAAAAAAWRSHGDTAKQTIANWMPGFAAASPPPAETAAPPAQTDTPAAEVVAAEQTPAPPAEAAAQPAESAAPAASAPSPETAQLQSMARDLAAMAQQVEQLQASIAELKASQEAASRDLAKSSESKAAETKPAARNPRPRTAAAPPRTATAPPHRPLPVYAPAQVAAQPAPPVSTLPAPPPPPATGRTEDGEPIVRPPMPLR
ncbi:hypothetical protein [Bradyrhizobium sp.]|uniref:hypothetical protein n=1 Tax=Bradyrhizobium sp. TaxID=376 RepID=UPI002734C0D2|nr:hypothetical protein [Bradyrhizobium sp.]MDP3689542.1 hypothetical protein [Bradyrhizobium sp.]